MLCRKQNTFIITFLRSRIKILKARSADEGGGEKYVRYSFSIWLMNGFVVSVVHFVGVDNFVYSTGLLNHCKIADISINNVSSTYIWQRQ